MKKQEISSTNFKEHAMNNITLKIIKKHFSLVSVLSVTKAAIKFPGRGFKPEYTVLKSSAFCHMITSFKQCSYVPRRPESFTLRTLYKHIFQSLQSPLCILRHC